MFGVGKNKTTTTEKEFSELRARFSELENYFAEKIDKLVSSMNSLLTLVDVFGKQLSDYSYKLPVLDEVEMVGKLSAEFKPLEDAVKKKNEKINELEAFCLSLETKTEQKLNDFYKEFNDRYFNTLNALSQWGKEISLVSFLSKGKDVDFTKLKRELTRPFVEEEWSRKHAQEAEKINKALASKGEKVRKAWEKYKEEKLALERQGGSTSLVDAKLEILTILMEGLDAQGS